MSKRMLLTADEYHAAVLKTESKPERLTVGPMTLFMALNLAVETSKILDHFKRAVFYGKDINQEAAITSLQTVGKLVADISFPVGTGRYRDQQDGDFFQGVPAETRAAITPGNVNLRLLHAALGLQTESGEFIEALLPSFFGGPVDGTNLLEEVGDSGWYQEIALDELGFTKAQVDTANIRKLQDKKNGRYKKGTFAATDAVESRDVGAERVLLDDSADRKLTDVEATAQIHKRAA
jgi:hypothetical protein